MFTMSMSCTLNVMDLASALGSIISFTSEVKFRMSTYFKLRSLVLAVQAYVTLKTKILFRVSRPCLIDKLLVVALHYPSTNSLALIFICRLLIIS